MPKGQEGANMLLTFMNHVQSNEVGNLQVKEIQSWENEIRKCIAHNIEVIKTEKNILEKAKEVYSELES